MAKFMFNGTPYKFVSMKVNGIECIVRSITGRFALEGEQLDLERELAESDMKEAKEVIACLMKR